MFFFSLFSIVHGIFKEKEYMLTVSGGRNPFSPVRIKPKLNCLFQGLEETHKIWLFLIVFQL